MAENWFTSGGKVINFSGRPISMHVTTYNGQPYGVVLEDGSSGVLPSGLLSQIMYFGGNQNVSFYFTEPENIKEVNLADSLLIDVDTFDAPNLTRLRLVSTARLLGNTVNIPRSVNDLDSNNNTLSGDVADLPSGLTFTYLTGQNTVIYSGKTWSNNQQRHYYRGTLFTSQMVDSYLNDLSNVNNWTGLKSVDLRTSPLVPRTSASDAAVAILQSKGVTVLTH